MEKTEKRQVSVPSAPADNGRITFVDYIRVIACFMVMLVHASENFYGADSSGLAGNMSMLATESNRFWVSFWDGGVSRTAVPLFMIVSAFLLVPMKPGMSMTDFYKRRFMRILPPFIVFLLLYTFLPLLWGGMSWNQSLNDLRLLPWNFPSMGGHLWFMYPLLGLYLFIPVISPWLERATAKEERIFIGIFVFTTFIPFFHRFVNAELWGECFWNEFTLFWYFSGYIGYLVLAHYIRVHLQWNRSKRFWVGIASFAVGAVFTAWSFWLKGDPGVLIATPDIEWAWQFCTPNVLLATFGAFLLFTCIEQRKAPALITDLGKLSFGMYLMHMFYLAFFAGLLIGGDRANPLLPVWLCIPVIAVLTFVSSAVTAKVLSLLPGSKYYIGA